MFGHLLFFLTALCWFGLAASNFSKPPGSGDNVMGYGLVMAFLGIAFALCSGGLLFHLAYKANFDWAARQPGLSLLMLSGWLMLAAATFFCAIGKWEPGMNEIFPGYIVWLSKKGRVELWLPLLFLMAGFILLSDERKAAVHPGVYQWLLKICYILSAVICAGLLLGWMRGEQAAQKAHIEYQIAEDQRRIQENLEWIAQQKPEDPIINIISFTGRFTEKAVRDAALAKLQSHADLEGDLVDLLKHKTHYHYAYIYLDGNAVEHPERLVAPLKNSLLLMANEIRNNIEDSNNLQDWHFEHLGMERLLRMIEDPFGAHADFRPELQQVLAAFDTPKPERFKHVRFSTRRVLAQWLEAHP